MCLYIVLLELFTLATFTMLWICIAATIAALLPGKTVAAENEVCYDLRVQEFKSSRVQEFKSSRVVI